MKRLALCADDFGAFPGADAGILRLVDLGRLGGVSCQVAGGAFAADAPALRERAGAVDAGLHLDLAAGRGGLAALLARSHARALDRRRVADRISVQLDAFERTLGRPPPFVDGHQHVHQLPVIRDALLDVLASRYGSPGPLVRNTVPLRSRGAKAFALAALGGFGLRRTLRARGVPHNADFAGVYGLDARADYAALFRSWLAGAADRTLLLCHPGLASADAGDPIGPARAAELAFLSSPAFDEDGRAAGATWVRVSSLAR
ncbi:MAG TPA: ChbG/HpnK family deacetylase [Anaeromyxobacter sp.]